MAIEIDIKKKFKGFHLDVTFKNKESRLGILGASGCGKSMTLKCIAGIEKPDKGKIIIGNRVFFDSEEKINLKPQERKVGYLFQNYALFPNMTVEENIGITRKRKNGKEIEKQIERFHLYGLEKRYPAQLSGGQQQRVALARIMVYNPEVIILDEPFSALDSFLSDALQQELLEILEEYQGDVLMVSHNRDEIYRFCNRLAVIENGKILLTGETKDIFINPKKKEVAKLTGCKNISSIYKKGDFEIYAEDWGICLRTKTKINDNIRYVGIRAHALKLGFERSKENTIEVIVAGTSEAPFETQHLLKTIGMKENDKNYLWIKYPKNRVGKRLQEGDYQEILENHYKYERPLYLTLPLEELMLLE